jgi:hypothetical protein
MSKTQSQAENKVVSMHTTFMHNANHHCISSSNHTYSSFVKFFFCDHFRMSIVTVYKDFLVIVSGSVLPKSIISVSVRVSFSKISRLLMLHHKLEIGLSLYKVHVV